MHVQPQSMGTPHDITRVLKLGTLVRLTLMTACHRLVPAEANVARRLRQMGGGGI